MEINVFFVSASLALVRTKNCLLKVELLIVTRNNDLKHVLDRHNTDQLPVVRPDRVINRTRVGNAGASEDALTFLSLLNLLDAVNAKSAFVVFTDRQQPFSIFGEGKLPHRPPMETIDWRTDLLTRLGVPDENID